MRRGCCSMLSVRCCLLAAEIRNRAARWSGKTSLLGAVSITIWELWVRGWSNCAYLTRFASGPLFDKPFR